MKTILSTLLVAGLTLAILPGRPAAGETASSSDTEDLVKKERLRSQVEAIFADLHNPPPRDEKQAPLFTWITERLLALGPDVAPLMQAEIESRSRLTYNVAAYVLGFLHPPGAKEALLKAAEEANQDLGPFGHDRKLWVAYALAVSGDPEAVDVLDSGKVNCIRKEFVHDMTVLEVVSILTAPGSTARLLEKLDRYGKSDDRELKDRLYIVLNALRRVADPSIREKVLPYLTNEQPYVRDAAAKALAATGDPAVVDRLIAALEDPAGFSRFGTAMALEGLKPPGRTKQLLARLEVEQESAIRGALYRTLAATGGESMVEPLLNQWGRDDALDRTLLVDAVGKIGSRKAINFFRNALQDPDNRVVLHAMAGLAAIGGPGPTDSLLALLQDPRWPVEEEAIRLLVQQHETRAAPRIADKVRQALAAPISDPTEREATFIRAEALADLRFTGVLADVRKALEIQSDPTVLDFLQGLGKRLSAYQERKDDVSRWVDALASGDPDLRRLAYRRLGELKAPGAVRALTESFGRVDVDEGEEVLRSLGRIAPQEAAPLLERVLLDPSFDAYERAPLRSMAAWAASRVGGAKMGDLLRRAAERRDGRDVDVLVYLAVLTGRDALPLLEALRAPRLRWFDWHRGPELERLDWIVRELRAGRSIESLNRPPDEIALE